MGQDLRTDEGLMLAYREGDAAAFEVLYARHRTRLYRYPPTSVATPAWPKSSTRTSGCA